MQILIKHRQQCALRHCTQKDGRDRWYQCWANAVFEKNVYLSMCSPNRHRFRVY